MKTVPYQTVILLTALALVAGLLIGNKVLPVIITSKT